ncbi:MAG: VCBS repeat-containing protein, partial [Planctomycetota bacterium]
ALLAGGIAFGQDARFDARSALATTGPVQALAVADLDGDGDADVLASDSAGGRLVWIENNSDVDPGFTVEHEVATSVIAPNEVAAADLDSDGDLDVLAASSPGTGQLVWFENIGGVPPRFEPRAIGPRPNLELTGVVRSIAVADLQGDGDLDLICGFQLPTSAASGHVTVYLNDGTPSPGFVRFQLPSPAARLAEVTSVAVADVGGDGLPDIVASSREPSPAGDADSVVAWRNTGSPGPGFVPSVVASGLDGASSLAVAQLSSDALPDLAVALPSLDRVFVFESNAATPGTFLGPQPLLASGVQEVVAADVVGSALSDLVAATLAGPVVFENLGGGALSFAASQFAQVGGTVESIALGNLDDDGDVDVVAAGSAGAIWIERVAPIENLSTGSLHPSLEDAIAGAGAGDVLRGAPEHFVPNAVIPASAVPYELESTGPLTLGPRVTAEVLGMTTLRSLPGTEVRIDGTISFTPGAVLAVDSATQIALTASQVLLCTAEN